LSQITAQIKFITPLLVGGANNDAGKWKLDDIGLRAASLRGALRFWYRAIAGPIISLPQNHQERSLFLTKLHFSENLLFGSCPFGKRV